MRDLHLTALLSALFVLGCGNSEPSVNPTLVGMSSTDSGGMGGADVSSADASGDKDAQQSLDTSGGGDTSASDTYVVDAGDAGGNAEDAQGSDVSGEDAGQPDAVSEDGGALPDATEDALEPVDGGTQDTATGPMDADAGAGTDAGGDALGEDGATADGGSPSDATVNLDVGQDATGTDTATSDTGACTPVAEACDGVDNDCDGQVDEGNLCDDGKPCTDDACAGAAGCKHTPKPAQKPCPGLAVGNKCYKAFKHSARGWSASEQACVGWGGHLASIPSDVVNNQLLQHGKSVCGAGIFAWIGLNDIDNEGTFKWTNGAPVPFTNWAWNEPNNFLNEDVVAMRYDGKWNDQSDKVPLLCTLCERVSVYTCDDGDACTKDDKCVSTGNCVGQQISCDDGNACTTDICDPKVGCSHGKLANGSPCAGMGACVAGVCKLGTVSNPAPSCLAIKQANADAPTGVYTLDEDGTGPSAPYKAWCEMKADGGGWTLVLKIDGDKSEFDYDDKRWEETKPYNEGLVDMSENQSKYRSYWQVAVKQLRVGMKVNGKVRWLKVPVVGDSLWALIAPGKYVKTTVGRDAWLSLIDGASLQVNCNQEGLNVGNKDSQARIGIVGNNEKNCGSPNSRLGFGGEGDSCGQDDDISCGNTAKCGGHKGDAKTKAFGWVFVR